MRLNEFFKPGHLGLSFEVFPTKTDEAFETLMGTIGELKEFKPDFFTCTYGAGGSTRDRTIQIIEALKNRFSQRVASHLTCVGSTVEQLRDYLDHAVSLGTDYIVALRGDPPKGQSEFQQTVGGLRYANELVSLIKSDYPQLGIAVAGYPEIHQEAPSAQVDLDNLKRKVDSGADIVVTQLFYDNQDFYRFVDQCEKAGIRVPIVPGILPILNLKGILRFTQLCKAKLPASLIEKLSEKDDEAWQSKVGVDYAIEQVSDLLQHGIPGMHFYVLNRSDSVGRVLQAVWPNR
jgi:methylenetetrahydrofolate reductase (NADPH)